VGERGGEKREGRPAGFETGPGGDGAPDSVEQRGLILLVEDNEMDREVYGRLLWYNGYGLVHAADGESAIALAHDAHPDLIILDMMLEGELTGLDVAVRLRDEGVKVPMIGLSAVSRAEFGSAIEEAGIAAYLEKPVDPFVVVKEVLRQLGAGPAGGS
jgi:CheY-like chemotaxis protein